MNFPATTSTRAQRSAPARAGAARKFGRAGEAAFTMIEIALSIAVVAFAMVAILGVLPTGHQVQRENREDTIIDQDGRYLLEAIRSGLRGNTDLSNFVDSVSIRRSDLGLRNYSRLTSPDIIGLMTTPKFVVAGNRVLTNGVNVVMHSISDTALHSPPPPENAKNYDHDLAFKYLVIPEVIPVNTTPTNGLPRAELQRVLALSSNLHELRLTFRWPVLPSRSSDPVGTVRTGQGRRTFSTLVSGQIIETKGDTVRGAGSFVYYFQPSVFQ